MKLLHRKIIVAIAVVACACAEAQTFPSKPLRIVIAFPAGVMPLVNR